MGQWSLAADDCAELVRHRPGDWEANYLHGVALVNLQRGEDAIAAFTHAIEAKAEGICCWSARGDQYAELGRFDLAAADFGRIVEVAPGQLQVWHKLALTQLGSGDAEAYRQTCDRLLRQAARPPAAALGGLGLAAAPGDPLGVAVWAAAAPKVQAARVNDRSAAAWVCGLRPDAVSDPTRLLPLAENQNPLLRGIVLCRAGRHDEAVKVLAPLNAAVPRLFLALAHSGGGRRDEARKALDDAVRLWDRSGPAPQLAGSRPWQPRFEMELLRREVEAALDPAKAGR
jgi:tetratricopeptide (TPR) repeat protein